jgi:hypothetical protein
MGKVEELKVELAKQKDYYEEALEIRFKQMEEFEEEVMQLRQQLHDVQNSG